MLPNVEGYEIIYCIEDLYKSSVYMGDFYYIRDFTVGNDDDNNVTYHEIYNTDGYVHSLYSSDVYRYFITLDEYIRRNRMLIIQNILS